jgi:hypothetical protein
LSPPTNSGVEVTVASTLAAPAAKGSTQRRMNGVSRAATTPIFLDWLSRAASTPAR